MTLINILHRLYCIIKVYILIVLLFTLCIFVCILGKLAKQDQISSLSVAIFVIQSFF